MLRKITLFWDKFMPPIVTTAGLQSTAGASSSAGTSLGNSRGAWSATPTYAKNDLVFYGGQVWMALQKNTNQAPADGGYWTSTGALPLTRTALKALVPTTSRLAYLLEAGRSGFFLWTTGDFSARVAADSVNALYIKADTIAATTGAWARQFTGPCDIRWWGAVGDGVTDDSAAINAALAHGNIHLYFPALSYKAASYLRLYSGNHLEGAPGSIIYGYNTTTDNLFLNGESGNQSYATLYDGEGNLWFDGLTMDLTHAGEGVNSACEAIGITHARNVLIENCTFQNNKNDHFIELNATQHAIVRNCVFKSQTNTNVSSHECINIDFNGTGNNFPNLGANDNTVCDDILVENNTCIDTYGLVAAHTHSPQIAQKHTNIRVIGNRIENSSGHSIGATYWERSVVADNVIINSAIDGIKVWAFIDGEVRGNHIYGGCSNSGIYLNDDSSQRTVNAVVYDNTIDSVTGVGILISDSDYAVVSKNTIYASGLEAIQENGGNYSVIRGNVILGANQSNGGKAAIRLTSNATKPRVFDNVINHNGLSTQYAYALGITAGVTDCAYSASDHVAGSSGTLSDAGTRTTRGYDTIIGTATYNPPSLADGVGTTTTVTVAGAALGDFVDLLSFSLDLQGIIVTGYVSATDTVAVRFQNESGGTLDLASGTLTARVKKNV